MTLASRHHFPRHSHDQFGIGVITFGAQRSWSGVGHVSASAGDVIMANPGEVHDGANLIQQQGDASLDKTAKMPWGNLLVHTSYIWTFGVEHYGQLVVYYRANNLVPPDSRR